jgi:amino acid transporter
MKQATKTTVVAVALFFVSIWVIIAAGVTAVWLTEEVRVVSLVMLPAATVAALLVVFFEWRAKLPNPIPDERNEHRKAA